jgi:predicted dienelactone hydrolase
VLGLAGARTDLRAFRAFCTSPEADAVCHPPEMARIGRGAVTMTPATEASFARSGDSYRDPRVRAVFAMAPALGKAFDASSLATINIPVALIAGTSDLTVPPRTNAERVASIGHAPLTLLRGASHYSFLPICAPFGEASQPAICREAGSVTRQVIHASAISAAKSFFDDNLMPAKN